MADHVVAIEVGGQSFTGWDVVSIGMAIDCCADQFSLTAMYDPRRPDLVAAFEGSIYKPCVITIDGEAVLTGRIEKLAATSGADDRSLTVEGRSLTAPLIDCSIDGDLQISEDMNLSDLCRKVCRPFGVGVRADNDGPVSPQREQYGQKCYDFLASVAMPRNFLLNSAYDGRLVITDTLDMLNRPVVAALIEGELPVLAISTNNDGTKRFSVYKVAAQSEEGEDAVDEATDPSVTLYRPNLSIEKDAMKSPVTLTLAQAKAASKKVRSAALARTAAIASSFTVNATLSGWRDPSGKRWHERSMVTVYAPAVMLSRESKYVIAGINFKLSPDDGETVDMRLSLPELYAGALPLGNAEWQ